MKSFVSYYHFRVFLPIQIAGSAKRVFWIIIIIITCVWGTSLFSQTLQDDTAQVGEFTTTSSVIEILGEASAKSFEPIISVDKPIEWAVYVSKNYDSQVPAGILVYISANNSGTIPNEWKEIIDNHNLIWIGANKSGNKIATSHRVIFAILAPAVISNNYNINADRIYVSGFSGGGRVSSMVATEYAHLFKGAIYISGANFWSEDKPKHYDKIKKNHYVFITGTKDFNLGDTKEVYNAYKSAGIPNIKLLVIPFMSHEKPPVRKYEEAIDFLDSRATHKEAKINDR